MPRRSGPQGPPAGPTPTAVPGQPTADAGLFAARRQLVVGVRLTARIIEAVELVARGRRRALALPLVSLVGDLRLLAKLEHPEWSPGWKDWLLDAADVAVRSALADPHQPDELHAVVAATVPTGALAGFRATAGQNAQPVVPGAAPWPPTDVRAAGRTVLQAAVPLALTSVGHLVGTRVGRRPARLGQFFQVVVVSTGLGVALARHRDQLQHQARAAYRDRTRREIDHEHDVALVNARTAPGPGHDFAKTLVALGRLGDQACEKAGRRALDSPRRLLEDRLDGATLRSVVGDVRIEPADAGRAWIAADEIPRLQVRLAQAEDQAADGADQTLFVEVLRGRRLSLRWLDQPIDVDAEAPPMQDRFHSTTVAFFLGANYKLLSILSGIAPRRVLPGAALDLVAAWYHRGPTSDRRIGSALGWAVAASVVQTVLTAGGPPPSPPRGATLLGLGPPVVATANATGAALLWSSQWGRLDGGQRALALVPALCWAYTMVRARPLGWARWVIEASYIAMPMLASWRLTDRLDQEAEILGSVLQHELESDVERARQAAEASVISEYRQALATARRGIDRYRGSIPHRLLGHLEADCDELEAWLATR